MVPLVCTVSYSSVGISRVEPCESQVQVSRVEQEVWPGPALCTDSMGSTAAFQDREETTAVGGDSYGTEHNGEGKNAVFNQYLDNLQFTHIQHDQQSL